MKTSFGATDRTVAEDLSLTDGPFLEDESTTRGATHSNDYVMVVEEINRGNPAQILRRDADAC